MIKYNKSTIVRSQSATVSGFCVRLASKRYILKIIIQVTMKHDP